MKKRSVALAVPLVLAFMLPAWSRAASETQAQQASAAPSLAEVAPEVVATVNGKSLTRDELAALAIGIHGRETLDALISREVIRQEAERQGVAATTDEIEAYARERAAEQLDSLARRMGAENMADFAAKSGRTPEHLEELRRSAVQSLRPFVGPELLARKLMLKENVVTDAHLRAEFDRQFGPKARVLQIVLPTRQSAEEALRKLRSGADFAQLAREVSIDRVSARAGGEMPPLAKGSPVADAAFATAVGQIGPIVETTDGFHVIKVVEIVAAREVSFDAVQEPLRKEIADRLLRDTQEKWLKELLGKAVINRSL